MESRHLEIEVNKVDKASCLLPNIISIQNSQTRKRQHKEHLPKGRYREIQAPLSLWALKQELWASAAEST